MINPLSEREQQALRYWQNSTQSEISPDTAARMFTLFLQGQTCEQIHRLNTGFSLGQVVRARVAGEWDRLRDEYQTDLLELTRIRAMQTTLESTNFLADMIGAAHSDFGERFRRFQLTRDPKDLGALKIDSLYDYKNAIAIFMAITGQGNKQKVEGEVLHKHQHETKPSADLVKEMAPEVAAEVLKLLGAPATKR